MVKFSFRLVDKANAKKASTPDGLFSFALISGDEVSRLFMCCELSLRSLITIRANRIQNFSDTVPAGLPRSWRPSVLQNNLRYTSILPSITPTGHVAGAWNPQSPRSATHSQPQR